MTFDDILEIHVDRVRKLRILAIEYETRCEQYDMKICTGRSQRGSCMPANRQELGLVCQNARRTIMEIAGREKIDIRDLQLTISTLS